MDKIPDVNAPITTPSSSNTPFPPKDAMKYLKELVHPHTGSFNYALSQVNLKNSIAHIPKMEILLTPLNFDADEEEDKDDEDVDDNHDEDEDGDNETSSKKKKKSSSKKAKSKSKRKSNAEDATPLVYQFWYSSIQVHKPITGLGTPLYPSECRERGLDYGAPLVATISHQLGNEMLEPFQVALGQIPIMVGSEHCNLYGLEPHEIVVRNEDASEMGGYFICNGIEKLVRMLQIPHRHYIIGLDRSAFLKRGPEYTSLATVIRCVGPGEISRTVTLHYLKDGSARVRVMIRKTEYFIPLIMLLKALRAPRIISGQGSTSSSNENPTSSADNEYAKMVSDKEIFDAVLRGRNKNDTFTRIRVELALSQAEKTGILTPEQCRAHLGEKFRGVLQGLPLLATNDEAGQFFLDRFVLIHLSQNAFASSGFVDSVHQDIKHYQQMQTAKFDILVEMWKKLFALAKGESGFDNADSIQTQEILLSGHIYGMLLKENLENTLILAGRSMIKTLSSAYRGATASTAGNALSKSVARLQERLGYTLPVSLVIGMTQTNMKELKNPKTLSKAFQRVAGIGKALFYFLSTGNLVSDTGLDMMQKNGYSVVAEKLNRFRFLAHFRSVHRGSYFATMKTTTVRKLLPDSWGFVCPVHTPDGGPCGLLNHFAATATAITHPLPRDANFNINTFTDILCEWGMIPMSGQIPETALNGKDPLLPVILEGRVIGHAEPHVAETIAVMLRQAKAEVLNQVFPWDVEDHRPVRTISTTLQTRKPYKPFPTCEAIRKLCLPESINGVPATMEVALIPPSKHKGGTWPGLFLFVGPSRMLRPVVQVKTGIVELIGPLEQSYMSIAVRDEELDERINTHVEIAPTSMLSLLASLTPFSDFNQSPRNMYQCQMGKQTMGTPVHNWAHRTDVKSYRIQTPQAPIVQNDAHMAYAMDEYPNGTNAVVAVISYTGFDMEDAMILNKSALERGFGHATVYKTKLLTAGREDSSGGGRGKAEIQQTNKVRFANENPAKPGQLATKELAPDGLPHLGQKLTNGQPLACIVDDQSKTFYFEKFKDTEDCIVDQVRVLGSVPVITKANPYMSSGHGASAEELSKKHDMESEHSTTMTPSMVSITLRYNRNPVVGDKFSSRHGQKGVLSVAWPQSDMPFTESGMTPDVIINPHAFPSRMTIGMLVESMAGKAGALHGVFQDGTPFKMQGDEEGETAVDFFGDQLRAAGYAYHGSEPMYSGVLGTLLRCDIYIGVVYYQRLRHMVSDKSQVRSLGPVHALTNQPIKGRKRHGGVRFGEMERDSLLAHGVGFLIQDRLLNCSDRHTAYLCCGSLLSVHRVYDPSSKNPRASAMQCRLCGKCDQYRTVTIPFVISYLVNELAAMGMNITIA